MKKQDLKTGMQVETTRGEKRYVLLGTESGDITTNSNTTDCNGFHRLYNTWELSNWNNDLTHKDDKTHKIGDIVKVYGFWGNLIWEREQIPEYTMPELIEKIGHEFKIIK